MKTGTWRNHYRDDPFEAHVMPNDDFREHAPTMQCWCNPKEDDTPRVFVHNAMDQREKYERGEMQPQ